MPETVVGVQRRGDSQGEWITLALLEGRGTSSDLRTGLPKQMIEIHEAMRLQVMVEAKIEVLSKIYARQPALQELVGKGWLLLSAKDPDSEQIQVFIPDKGFVPWNGQRKEIAR